MNCSKLKILKIVLKEAYYSNVLVNFFIFIITSSLLISMIFLIKASGFHLPSTHDVYNSSNSDTDSVLNNGTQQTNINEERATNNSSTIFPHLHFTKREEGESERNVTEKLRHHPVLQMINEDKSKNYDNLPTITTWTELFDKGTHPGPIIATTLTSSSPPPATFNISKKNQSIDVPFSISVYSTLATTDKYKETTPLIERSSSMINASLQKSKNSTFPQEVIGKLSNITESYKNILITSENSMLQRQNSQPTEIPKTSKDRNTFLYKEQTLEEREPVKIKPNKEIYNLAKGGTKYKELKSHLPQYVKHFGGTNYRIDSPDHANRNFYEELPYLMASNRIVENNPSIKKVRLSSANNPQKFTKNSKRDLNGISLNEINTKYGLDLEPKPTNPETDAEREEKFNKALEKFVQVINFFGEMDSYFSTRLKNSIKKLAKLCEEDGPII